MGKVIKKSLILLLILAIGVMSFVACKNKDDKSNESKTFKIGTANGSLCLVPIHMAESLGYFEEEFKEAGVSYELVEIDMNQASELIAQQLQTESIACVRMPGSVTESEIGTMLDSLVSEKGVIWSTAGMHMNVLWVMK